MTKIFSFILCSAFIFTCLFGCANQSLKCNNANDGRPFGQVTENDLKSLYSFAQRKGYNLEQDFQLLYQKDSEAFGRVFSISDEFTEVNGATKAYGQVIYSSLLNLGEAFGLEFFANEINSQKPSVQQRVRDFLYCPVASQPIEVEQETRELYPLLFPASYIYGQGNSLVR